MEEQAAEWLALLRDAEAGREDLLAFERWLAADPGHRSAFHAIARCWGSLDQFGSADPILRLREDALRALGSSRGPDRAVASLDRRVPRRALVGIAMLLVGAAAVAGWTERVDERHLATAKGELRSVALRDGSELVLDADTELVARLTPFARTVKLLRGQALFHVAHDSLRPFEVVAERISARALGTVYQVALRPNRILVGVREGRVAVDDAVASYSTELGSSQFLTIARDSRARSLQRDSENRQFAWLGGQLDVDSTPLRDVVAEINHYVERPIAIAAPGLGDLPVSGVFDPHRPEGFLEALARIHPVAVERAPDGSIRLVPRH